MSTRLLSRIPSIIHIMTPLSTLSGDDRASIVMPDIDDDAGDIFAARFGAAWNNGENVTIKEAPSLFDINLETDNQGMTMVRLHK